MKLRPLRRDAAAHGTGDNLNVEAAASMKRGSLLGSRPEAVLLNPVIKAHLYHSPPELPISGKSVFFSFLLAPFSSELVGFHRVTPYIKGRESLPTKKVLLHLRVGFNLRPEAPHKLFFPPCVRCRNQLTT